VILLTHLSFVSMTEVVAVEQMACVHRLHARQPSVAPSTELLAAANAAFGASSLVDLIVAKNVEPIVMRQCGIGPAELSGLCCASRKCRAAS